MSMTILKDNQSPVINLNPNNIEDIVAQFYGEESKESHGCLFPTHNIYECPKCEKDGLYNESGVITCRRCHSEFGGIIDEGAEWSMYQNGESQKSDPNRCGAVNNPLMVESSYGGVIAYSRYPAHNRLKLLNNWQAMPTHERTLKQVFDRLTQNGRDHGLTSNIIEFSHQLFVEVMAHQVKLEASALRGDPREGIISACLFYSCHEFNVARSAAEISNICEIDEESVNRGLNLFYDIMKDSSMIKINQYRIKYTDFIDRYCNKLELSESVSKAVRQLADRVYKKKLLNNNIPQALVCACIFYISTTYRLPITKQDIYLACGICTPTITKAYEKLLPHTPDLL